MTISRLPARKSIAAVLSAALLVSAPGPLAVQAVAQVVNMGAVRAVPGVSGAAGASLSGQSLSSPSLAPMNTPSLSALSAPPVVAGAPAAALSAAAVAPALAPAAVPVLAPGAVLSALPSASIPAAAVSARVPAAPAPATAFASSRELGARLESAKEDAGGAKTASALDSFYNGINAAASCVFAPKDPSKGPSSGLSRADAPVGSPSSRFKISPLRHAAMGTMALVWQAWDRAIGGKWDKMPAILGELYLYMNEQSLRLHMWDASAQPSTDKTVYAPAGETEKTSRSADGSYFDDQDPAMSKAGARFNQLRTPKPVDPNWASKGPSALEISEKLEKREGGKTKEAGILNDLSAGHIQFNVHDWENHERQPIAQDPLKFPIPEGHPLAADGSKEMTLDRTAVDPSLPAAYAGPRTSRNMETSGWDMSNIYGSSLERQLKVRSMKDGKMKIGDDGRLLDDPEKPGVPLTGFNDNMSPQLIMMHTIWTLEHNYVADMVKSEHPEWNDERIFQMARLRISALNARLHTTEWTRALLPNKTLRSGMWHDWYGFMGKRAKLWIMRFTDRHPKLGRLVFNPLIRNELTFGVTGTSTQHFGKHYSFVEEFPDVYRLHTMLRDEYLMQRIEAGPNGEVTVRVLKNEKLEDMIGFKSRDKMKEYSNQDWMLTFLMESAGSLSLNNFPEALRALTTQDGRRIDLAAVDVIRNRERLEANTYVKFTLRLGEKPPKTFLELTGGDQEAADKLASVYKSVNDVDFQQGIQAERKPDGFALGNRQFKVFVLSAPARLKNDRFLSEQYDAKYYGASGMEYVEHTNFSHLIERHYPALRPVVEGVENAFAPMPQAGTLNDRLVKNAQDSALAAIRPTVVNYGFGSLLGTAALMLGAASLTTALSLILFPAAAVLAQAVLFPRSAGALKGVLSASKNGDRSALANLFTAEKRGRLSAFAAKNAALTVIDLGGLIAYHMFAAHPIGALLLGGVALYSGLKALTTARRASADLTAARVGLSATLTKDLPHADPKDLRGDTAIQKRYWVMLGGKEGSVLKFGDTYSTLRRSGLSVSTAFMTAAMWHVPFARQTWKNAAAEKAAEKPGFLDIWIPGLIETQKPSNNRVFADGSKPSVKRGDVDMDEFNRLFRDFGAHDSLTAYDLARIREANQWRDAQEGRGNWFSRLIGRYAGKRRADQLIDLFADRVVWEDNLNGRLVPAISREQLLRFYQGGAHYDLIGARSAK
jgi:hypothetical protein